MLSILHIYDENNSMAAQYVAMLVKAVGDRATMSSATNAKAFKTLLAEQHPDIVHLHSKSPFALPSDIRLVVTPHGEPSPFNIQPSTFNLQPSPSPYVLIARSKMERDELIRQFPRVETILNPIITRTTTPEACARQMLHVYQRVMDSNVLQLMDDDTRQTLALILGTAVAGDPRWVEPLTASSPYRESQRGASYRQLYIYAEHEGILPLVEQGIGMLGISAPPKEEVESYLPEGYVKPKPMAGSDIVALIADIKANGPTLLRLSEIARALRNPQLDEQRLLQRLDDGNLQGKNLRPLFASILQLLSEQFLLTEGFMPCPPADNRETQQLRRMLEQHGCI